MNSKVVDKQGNQYLVESVGREYGIIIKDGVRKRIPINYLLEECQRLDEDAVDPIQVKKFIALVRTHRSGMRKFIRNSLEQEVGKREMLRERIKAYEKVLNKSAINNINSTLNTIIAEYKIFLRAYKVGALEGEHRAKYGYLQGLADTLGSAAVYDLLPKQYLDRNREF